MRKDNSQMWNTKKIAVSGALIGILHSQINTPLWRYDVVEAMATAVGSAIGFSILFAIVSGIRNMACGGNKN
jgi:Na+-translocating ferredoxin:NAD+ oxidoreductase RnfA subunit